MIEKQKMRSQQGSEGVVYYNYYYYCLLHRQLFFIAQTRKKDIYILSSPVLHLISTPHQQLQYRANILIGGDATMGKQNRLTDFNLEREIFLTKTKDTCICFYILKQPPTKTRTKLELKLELILFDFCMVTKTNTKTKINLS